MRNIRIGVVEDDPASCQLVLDYLNRYQQENDEQFTVSVFDDGARIVEKYTPVYDILLLDIEMSEMDGMAAARRIRERDDKVVIVFITAAPQYAISGYEVRALSYLLKPLPWFAFSQELKKSIDMVRRNGDDSMLIDTSNGQMRLNLADILYLESIRHTIVIHTLEGKLSINASEFIYGSLHLFDPIINAEFSPQGVALRQFTSRWEGGMVRTSGNWLRNGKTLILDDVAIAGLEYTLPKNWQQLWMETTPGWLNSLQLKRFSASRNLIIDIDPDFPWQLTALDGYGATLTLVTDHKWGVWSGSANLNAAAATFNRVDVRRPSLALTANSSTVNISELSAFTEKGILEATASVSQTPQRQTHISLNGRGVPVNILQQWGWPELPLTGDGNIQLTASGDIQANIPLKPTVSGQLHAVNAAKQQVTQTMNAGVVSSGEVTSTEPVQ